MHKLIVTLLFLAAAASAVNAQNETECQANAHWNDCAASCITTCETAISGVVCNKRCDPRCQCDDGYVDDGTNSTCIPVSSCDPSVVKCPGNATFTTCASACPESCTNLGRPQACIDVCKVDCQCNQGYVWSDEYHTGCVLKQDCERKENCAPDMVYEYGSRKTCNGVIGRPYNGCHCRDDLVLDQSGRCVDRAMCPNSGENKQCRRQSAHSHYDTCHSSSCIQTCEHHDQTFCTMDCRRGCICDKGYVRRERDNQCVHVDQC